MLCRYHEGSVTVHTHVEITGTLEKGEEGGGEGGVKMERRGSGVREEGDDQREGGEEVK